MFPLQAVAAARMSPRSDAERVAYFRENLMRAIEDGRGERLRSDISDVDLLTLACGYAEIGALIVKDRTP